MINEKLVYDDDNDIRREIQSMFHVIFHLITRRTLVSFCNQPKAHFGLPWTIAVNVCHMNEKRIQCLSNASQHVPIYLQPFPSNVCLLFYILMR